MAKRGWSESDLATNFNDFESLAIEIINKKSKDVIIRAKYRQPASDFKQLKHILGDTNLNLIDSETKVKVTNYLNLLFQKNFIPSLINQQEHHAKMGQ